MDTQIYDFQIRVLVYPEDGEFAARALEMDLVAYGSNENAALKELVELIECQISFALQKKDEGLLLFPAEEEYFARWEAAHKAGLKRRVNKDRPMKLKAKAVAVVFRKRDLEQLAKRARERRFEPLAA